MENTGPLSNINKDSHILPPPPMPNASGITVLPPPPPPLPITKACYHPPAPTQQSTAYKVNELSTFGEIAIATKPKGNPLAEALKKKAGNLNAAPVRSDSGIGASPPPDKFGPSIRPHYSERQALAIRKIEEVLPKGRHPANFRTFEINIQATGKKMLLALAAHPEKYGSPYGDGQSENTGIGASRALNKLITAGFHTIIAFEEEESNEIKERFTKEGIEIAAKKGTPVDTHFELIHMVDFSKPELSAMKKVHSLVVAASKRGQNVAFYCGAGFGRSGVMAAAVTLVENLTHKAKDKELRREMPDRTELIEDIDHNPVATTPAVKQAVEFVRTEDPENGYPLREFNARASKVGPTVEKPEQFKALEELEVDIRESYGR